MINNLRIKLLQERTVGKCDLREQIHAVIEEKNELIEELEMLLFLYGNDDITHADLCKVCGNMQKEIEDDLATNVKLRLMFNRTFAQRRESARAKRKIVTQLRVYLKGKGLM